jgi:hypothetical protein
MPLQPNAEYSPAKAQRRKLKEKRFLPSVEMTNIFFALLRLCGRLFRLIGSRAAQLKKMWLNGLLKG